MTNLVRTDYVATEEDIKLHREALAKDMAAEHLPANREEANSEHRTREGIAATERKNAAVRTPEVLAQGGGGPRYANMPSVFRKSADLT